MMTARFPGENQMTVKQKQKTEFEQLLARLQKAAERPTALGCGPGVNNIGDLREVCKLLTDACLILEV